MNVIIAGGGKTGAALAGTLGDQGNQVTVIEIDPENMESLPASRVESGAISIVVGDGSEPQVLEACGIREADVFIAVTGSDTVNGLAAQRALYEYRVTKTVLKVRDENLRSLYDSLGLAAVNSVQLTVQNIMSALSG